MFITGDVPDAAFTSNNASLGYDRVQVSWWHGDIRRRRVV
jgi:hypothetical protein